MKNKKIISKLCNLNNVVDCGYDFDDNEDANDDNDEK